MIDLTGQTFDRWTVLKRAGSTPSNNATWYCKCVCGNESVVVGTSLRRGQSESCGCKSKEQKRRFLQSRVGPLNPRWNGGRHVMSLGYVKVYAVDHPSADSKGYILEHRLVMEKHLGRVLLRSEHVHHKNGVRDDNRIENLELWSRSHPPGQRVSDLLMWAKEIIALYEPNLNTSL